MASRAILYCKHCQTGYGCVGKAPAPDICPHCNSKADWSSTLEPRVPYELHRRDILLLHALRIDPEAALPS